MGAWIEIIVSKKRKTLDGSVAPHMGAWIEMKNGTRYTERRQSHPTWVRGLKLATLQSKWVGISRTPHGCVD